MSSKWTEASEKIQRVNGLSFTDNLTNNICISRLTDNGAKQHLNHMGTISGFGALTLVTSDLRINVRHFLSYLFHAQGGKAAKCPSGQVRIQKTRNSFSVANQTMR